MYFSVSMWRLKSITTVDQLSCKRWNFDLDTVHYENRYHAYCANHLAVLFQPIIAKMLCSGLFNIWRKCLVPKSVCVASVSLPKPVSIHLSVSILVSVQFDKFWLIFWVRATLVCTCFSKLNRRNSLRTFERSLIDPTFFYTWDHAYCVYWFREFVLWF